MNPQLWTPAQCAEFLQITTDKLSKHRIEGTGPDFVKIGRQVRYVPGKVVAWVDSCTQTTTKASGNG